MCTVCKLKIISACECYEQAYTHFSVHKILSKCSVSEYECDTCVCEHVCLCAYTRMSVHICIYIYTYKYI